MRIASVKQVLAIGMVDSIHFARWLSAANGLDIKFTILPSGPHRKVHPQIRRLVKSNPARYSMGTVASFFSLPIWLLDKKLDSRIRSGMLSRLLRSDHFEIVHFHEMQSGGYPLLRVHSHLLSKLKIFYTPYGSDIYWFQNFPWHLSRIKRVLQLVDGIFPECERDSELSRKYGFEGLTLARMPASGSFEMNEIVPTPIRDRSKIVVKGYGGTWGRATDVLKSLESIQDQLMDYEIHVTSVTRDVAREINRLKSTSKLRLIGHRKFSLTPQQMQALLNQARFHIAVSVSDGFPASLIEAMLFGAIPVQSDTACLPDSLLKISPKNFIGSDEWAGIGQLVLELDKDLAALQDLSNRFSSWTRDELTSPESFRMSISQAYGLA